MIEARRKQVLLVDNEEDVLLLLEHALETEGYETTTAWSGRQALELLARRNFDLVVLDDHLSDFDAEQLLDWLAVTQRSVPVIVTQNPGQTAQAAERYLSLGASAVVFKRSPHLIRARVDQVLPAA